MIHDNSSQQESASTPRSILVGSRGWQQEHWSGDFYPQDLPEDWRLSYYANEFPAVLVPALSWQAAGAELEDWSDEVHEEFRFYLQRDNEPSADIKKLGILAKQQLGPQFAGFVEFENELNNDVMLDRTCSVALINMQSKSLRGWREWLENNAANLQAIFLSDETLSYKELSEFKSLIELLNL